MRISDWSSDVCSSDLFYAPGVHRGFPDEHRCGNLPLAWRQCRYIAKECQHCPLCYEKGRPQQGIVVPAQYEIGNRPAHGYDRLRHERAGERSEEHTSELQSLMRISYANSCLKQKT